MTVNSIYIKEATSSRVIILTAIFLMAFTNATFFSHVLDAYPATLKNIAFLISLIVAFTGATIFLLSLICFKRSFKPVIITVLLVSSAASYFMDSYNTIIDDSMIQNIVNTDIAESRDLLSFKLAIYVIFLGILPSYFIYRLNIIFEPVKKAIISRLKLMSFTLLTMIAVILTFSDFYASFFRQHKSLRYYANPTFYVYSTIKYAKASLKSGTTPLKQIGLDAKTLATDRQRKLVIFAVGEAARADRFSLNGYARETTPLLKNEKLINFSNFWSCGTSTAISVPCMFSIYGSANYDREKIRTTENVLDILKHAGVNLLWLDNNSSSKGVAERIPHLNYKDSEINPVCDIECRDIGMLSNLQPYINEHQEGDIFIVLHQMGNHGPAYYKRYPSSFEKFKPVCKTSQLESCSKEKINNAYDNAILYTDYFLSKTIKFLNKNSGQFETALFYVSDHGESLGENNLYLHGLPNFIAPDVQRHVAAFLWLEKNFNNIDTDLLTLKQNNEFTHDNIFHTILGLMNIETSTYNNKLDIIYNN